MTREKIVRKVRNLAALLWSCQTLASTDTLDIFRIPMTPPDAPIKSQIMLTNRRNAMETLLLAAM